MTDTKPEPLTTHHLGILTEMFEGHKMTMLEAMASMEQRLERRMDERFERIELRLDVLELAVRKNSEDIRKNSEDIRKNSEDIRKNSEDIRKNSEDIAALTVEVAALRDRLARVEVIADQLVRDRAVQELERRVDTIEDHLGIRRA